MRGKQDPIRTIIEWQPGEKGKRGRAKSRWQVEVIYLPKYKNI